MPPNRTIRSAEYSSALTARSTANPGGRAVRRSRGLDGRCDDGAVQPGVTLRTEPRMRVGVLGGLAQGNTTLVTLAPRLYDISEGTDSRARPWGAVTDRAIVAQPAVLLLADATRRLDAETEAPIRLA